MGAGMGGRWGALEVWRVWKLEEVYKTKKDYFKINLIKYELCYYVSKTCCM